MAGQVLLVIFFGFVIFKSEDVCRTTKRMRKKGKILWHQCEIKTMLLPIKGLGPTNFLCINSCFCIKSICKETNQDSWTCLKKLYEMLFNTDFSSQCQNQWEPHPPNALNVKWVDPAFWRRPQCCLQRILSQGSFSDKGEKLSPESLLIEQESKQTVVRIEVASIKFRLYHLWITLLHHS